MSSPRGTDYGTVKSHQQKLFSDTASVSKRPQVAAESQTTYPIQVATAIEAWADCPYSAFNKLTRYDTIKSRP